MANDIENFDLQMIDWSQGIKSGLLTAIGGDADFEWLRLIAESDLDAFAQSEVAKQSKADGWRKHDPCLVQSHLSEASKLVDRCLSQRRDIYTLESEALLAGLRLIEDEQTHLNEREIARVHLQAAEATAKKGESIEELLNDNDAKQSLIRRAQIRLHNTDGSALNYWQRIQFLRKIYVNNLLLIIDHIVAAKIGLEHIFGITLNELPDANKQKAFLIDLVDWLRVAIDKFESGMPRESVYTVVRYVGHHHLLGTDVDASAVAEKLATSGPVTFKIEMTSANLPVPGKHRLLGVSVVPCFQDGFSRYALSINAVFSKYRAVNSATEQINAQAENAESQYGRTTADMNDRCRQDQIRSMLFPLTFTLPIQGTGGNEWRKPATHLISPGFGVSSTRLDSVPLETGHMVDGASPIGEWLIDVPDEYIFPSGIYSRQSLCSGNDPLLKLTDIAIVMRVATRS